MGPTEKSECWAPNRSNLIIATQLGLSVVLEICPLIPEFASSLFYLGSEIFGFFLFVFVCFEKECAHKEESVFPSHDDYVLT